MSSMKNIKHVSVRDKLNDYKNSKEYSIATENYLNEKMLLKKKTICKMVYYILCSIMNKIWLHISERTVIKS